MDSNIYHTTEKALGIVYKYKLLTEVIAEEMYDYLEQDKLLLKEENDADEEAVKQRISYLQIKLC